MNSSFWRDRQVLITGHTGFKGSWLTLWLLMQGADVWGYALPPESERSLFTALDLANQRQAGWGYFQYRLGEMNDAEALRQWVEQAQPEVVFHLAAQPLVRRSYADPLGTWQTNVLGSLQLLEALKSLQHPCAMVMVTTDKVYENREWVYGYRETDCLGGHDPYSASKAAMELAVASWRSSFCGDAAHQTPYLAIATARAGNVIGGGDWAVDRIVPDAVRSLSAGAAIAVRNSHSTRPWQHVLEPLGGYLLLAQRLLGHQQSAEKTVNPFARAFNFGPAIESNRSVKELITTVLQHWPGQWFDQSDPTAPHEAGLLHLVSDQARQLLGWQPRWDFETTVSRTIHWYRPVMMTGGSALEACLEDLATYGQ
ncbi:CDP-glucose 4,6-dehydratase [Synechococcus elongatus PCC 6301]|uniref:CDP-glucose 4,6-dehydratase n=1 Tax=Synechococcus sp. (strain ATCC 27144 / PCC 6301 / SAUG 1402/1) TaxID=269084 RepID=A0A0H3K9L1_SYNP6|nr:CDP-glucose 4,6-dehydratase [Synechococcus elongatus]BAD79631.1 CDP-glucose 4,6-dehydratase [Synechococcus elongatus PCC 6301]